MSELRRKPMTKSDKVYDVSNPTSNRNSPNHTPSLANPTHISEILVKNPNVKSIHSYIYHSIHARDEDNSNARD